jgi:signal transduction histidine kinase
MALVTDITERKRAETELQRQREILYQTEKLAALGGLAASIAHEVNSPLAIMSSRLEVMLMEAEDQPPSPELLEDIKMLHRTAQRVIRVSQALRAFGRHSPREHGPVDLNHVAGEVLLLVEKSMSTEGIRVATRLDPDLPRVRGDADQLQQVLLNLLTNAREAMPKGGEVRLETGAISEPRQVRLIVADAGVGIAPEELSKIFDLFYTTKQRGTGLGLSVSYGIIGEHRGTIDVQSDPGRGTTFVITLPAL